MYCVLLNKVLKRISTIFICGLSLLIISLISYGCSRSIISLEKSNEGVIYPMYGRVPARDFYYDQNLSDSLLFKWQFELNGSSPVSSVVIYGHYVFLNDLSGRIFCVDINTGKIAGQLKPKGAVYTTPVLENITVIYAAAKNDENYSELFFYDFINGKTIAEPDVINGRILTQIIKIDDGILFITENGRIYKYNFAGFKLFEYSTKKVTHSSPALGKNILVFGNDTGEMSGYDIVGQKLLYSEKISDYLLSGVSISGKIAYVGDYKGVLYAFDINSRKVLWEYNTGKRIDMMPVFDNDNVYIGNLGGEFFAINKTNGSLKWKTLTDGILNSPPLVAKNLIVLPDLNKKIHFINKANGTIQKSLEFEGRVKLSPVYFNNLLFIGYDDGFVEAYEIIN